jgi:DNA-binding XRE family transcriptional regulator
MTTLRNLREKENLTLRQLGEKLNIHWTTLHSFETGRRNPSFETADKIASYFNVPIEYIFPRYKRESPYPECTTSNTK